MSAASDEPAARKKRVVYARRPADLAAIAFGPEYVHPARKTARARVPCSLRQPTNSSERSHLIRSTLTADYARARPRLAQEYVGL